jgi:hypothetical protein
VSQISPASFNACLSNFTGACFVRTDSFDYRSRLVPVGPKQACGRPCFRLRVDSDRADQALRRRARPSPARPKPSSASVPNAGSNCGKVKTAP